MPGLGGATTALFIRWAQGAEGAGAVEGSQSPM
jgi:hypothetical protein